MTDIFLREVTGQDVYLYDPTAPDASDVNGTVESSTEAASSSSLAVGAAPVASPPAFGPGTFTWAGREQPQFVSLAIAADTETASHARARSRPVLSLAVASGSGSRAAALLSHDVPVPPAVAPRRPAVPQADPEPLAAAPPVVSLLAATGSSSASAASLGISDRLEKPDAHAWSDEDEESDLEDILMLLAAV